MIEAISANDFVIAICTPDYNRRSEDGSGGVGFETHMMWNDIRQNKPAGKYIAVLRQGDPRRSIPNWLYSTLRIDLRRGKSGGDYDETEYVSLLRKIHSRSDKPKLGRYWDEAALPADPVDLPPDVVGKLILPLPNSIVPRCTMCEATIENLPNEFDVWLLVYGTGSRLWYPNPIESKAQRWNFKLIVGSVDCSGADFRIALFITNKKGSEYLSTRIDGVSVLPPGHCEFVEVTRA